MDNVCILHNIMHFDVIKVFFSDFFPRGFVLVIVIFLFAIFYLQFLFSLSFLFNMSAQLPEFTNEQYPPDLELK